MKTVLVVAVHPDDETLGCGGTLLRHKSFKDSIHWLIVTSLNEKDPSNHPFIRNREQEIRAVKKAYPFDEVHELKYPSMHLDSVPMIDLVESISGIIADVKPQIVYLPFIHDVHSDHRIAFQAAYSCTKSFRYPFIEKILMMETLSETEFAPAISQSGFLPQIFVDITDFMERKIEILRTYRSEVRQHPFPRGEKAIESLAALRGSTAGFRYAESFMLLKELVR